MEEVGTNKESHNSAETESSEHIAVYKMFPTNIFPQTSGNPGKDETEGLWEAEEREDTRRTSSFETPESISYDLTEDEAVSRDPAMACAVPSACSS